MTTATTIRQQESQTREGYHDETASQALAPHEKTPAERRLEATAQTKRSRPTIDARNQTPEEFSAALKWAQEEHRRLSLELEHPHDALSKARDALLWLELAHTEVSQHEPEGLIAGRAATNGLAALLSMIGERLDLALDGLEQGGPEGREGAA